jgi:alpha-beta hydrolase superfamily lysophospholipase
VRLYPGGRHEMFNETNRAEVVTDLLEWLEHHVAR